MQPQLLPLLLLMQLLTCSCWAEAQTPRQLLSCPSEFETLVEPLPNPVGEPVLLLMGPGVQLRTVGFLQDGALRVESGRLLLGASTAEMRGPYSGPHVMLCSDTSQPLVTFSLYVRAPARPQLAPLRLLALTAAAIAVAVAGTVAVVALAVWRRRRSSSCSRDLRVAGDGHHRRYRDFRHLRAFRPQKLVESELPA